MRYLTYTRFLPTGWKLVRTISIATPQEAA
jgi:hypothetical protein